MEVNKFIYDIFSGLNKFIWKKSKMAAKKYYFSHNSTSRHRILIILMSTHVLEVNKFINDKFSGLIEDFIKICNKKSKMAAKKCYFSHNSTSRHNIWMIFMSTPMFSRSTNSFMIFSMVLLNSLFVKLVKGHIKIQDGRQKFYILGNFYFRKLSFFLDFQIGFFF